MSRPVIVRPAAEADIQGAYEWYEAQTPGLGSDFLLVVEATIEAIDRSPELYPIHHRNARHALLRRFPYALFYIIQMDAIEVVSCFHLRRHGVRWRSRL